MSGLLDGLRRALAPDAPQRTEKSSQEELRIATVALFLEVVRADFEITASEEAAVERAVGDFLRLDQAAAKDLIEAAKREVDESVELFQFTRQVDRRFPPEEKKQIVEHLWRIAWADTFLDSDEEALVRKLAGLLHVSHNDYIDAKLKAQR